MNFGLYLDDTRVPSDSYPNDNTVWFVVRDGDTFLEKLAKYWDKITIISLDHDLGLNYTGYDVLLKTAERFKLEGKKIVSHSANPVGKLNIENYVEFLTKYGKL